jgi:hypothetical protein
MVEGAAPRLSRSAALALVGILGLAAGLRVWGIGFGLPFGYARPDETYVMDVVRPLLLGQRPPPNYEYPWLYLGLTALGWCGYYAVGVIHGTFQTFAEMPESWRAHYTPFFLINRGITATLGVATVGLVFALGRRMATVRAGLVAAAFLAAAYLHVRDSHYGTTDVPMTFFATLTVLLIVRAHERRDPGAFVAAGLAGGLAGATKYTAIFVVVPAIVSAVIGAVERPGARLRTLAGRLAAFGLPCGVVAALGIPFALTDPAGFARNLQLLFASTTSGQAHLTLEPGWITHLKYSLWYGVGPAMLVAAAAGTAVLAARAPRHAALLLSFPVSYFAVIGAARNQYFRYVVPLVPFLCVAAAVALDAAVDQLRGRWSAVGSRRAAALAAVLTALVAAEPAARSWQFDRAMAATDNRVMVAAWITERVPPGSSLLITGSHYGHPWLPAERGYRLWVWDRREQRYWLPDDPGATRPQWILRQEHPLSADHSVVDEWLRDGYLVAWRFAAARPDGGSRTFDRMDAFYLPYAGFDGVSRPGPSFTLFRRADAGPRLAARR